MEGVQIVPMSFLIITSKAKIVRHVQEIKITTLIQGNAKQNTNLDYKLKR